MYVGKAQRVCTEHMKFHKTIILSIKIKYVLEVSYSAGFMCIKEQLYTNILVLTNYKKIRLWQMHTLSYLCS
jgi:hypothetical protein